MTWNKGFKIINMIFPLIGLGVVIFDKLCDSSCSYLKGTFAGLDLKYVGILFMALLLLLYLMSASRCAAAVNHLRTMMLSGALGGEILLIRFQIVHETYCPFCLAFGVCVFVIFVVNFMRMNRYLALASFLAGIGAFWLFFEGSVLPFYS